MSSPSRGQRAAGAALVWRPVALCHERPVRDANSCEIEHRAEVDGKAGAAWMVTAGGIDENNVRRLRKRPNCRLEQRAFPEREQARLVRGTRATWHDDALAAD